MIYKKFKQNNLAEFFGNADSQPDIILYFTEMIGVGFLNNL